MLTQLIENLVHLKRGNDGLDQNGSFHAALRHANGVLGRHEHLIPEPRFEMALQLGQVEVRTKTAGQQFLGVVEHIERKIEEPARYALPIDSHMLFIEVPATRAHDERRHLVVEVIRLAVLLQRDGAPDRIDQIDLPFDLVRPFWRVRIFEVGHVAVRTRVQRVDHHLAIGRTGDLNATALKSRRDRRNLPVAFADRFGFRQKVRTFTGVEALGALDPRGEQGTTPRLKLPMQADNQLERRGSQDLRIFGLDRTRDLHACGQMKCGAHWLISLVLGVDI